MQNLDELSNTLKIYDFPLPIAPMKWRYEKDNYVPKLCIRELNNFNSGAPNAGATLPAKTMNGRSKNVIKLSSRGGHAENEFVLSITANLAATSG